MILNVVSPLGHQMKLLLNRVQQLENLILEISGSIQELKLSQGPGIKLMNPAQIVETYDVIIPMNSTEHFEDINNKLNKDPSFQEDIVIHYNL